MKKGPRYLKTKLDLQILFFISLCNSLLISSDFNDTNCPIGVHFLIHPWGWIHDERMSLEKYLGRWGCKTQYITSLPAANTISISLKDVFIFRNKYKIVQKDLEDEEEQNGQWPR